MSKRLGSIVFESDKSGPICTLHRVPVHVQARRAQYGQSSGEYIVHIELEVQVWNLL